MIESIACSEHLPSAAGSSSSSSRVGNCRLSTSTKNTYILIYIHTYIRMEGGGGEHAIILARYVCTYAGERGNAAVAPQVRESEYH